MLKEEGENLLKVFRSSDKYTWMQPHNQTYSVQKFWRSRKINDCGKALLYSYLFHQPVAT